MDRKKLQTRLKCDYPESLFFNYKDEIPEDVRVSTLNDCFECKEKDCDLRHCLIKD